MKIRKGKSNYRMPPYSEIIHAVVRPKDAPSFHLQRIRDGSSERGKKGEPRFYFLSENGIEVSPVPQKSSGEIVVRFLPPVQEV